MHVTPRLVVPAHCRGWGGSLPMYKYTITHTLALYKLLNR